MIKCEPGIMQDQLVTSSNPGWVNVLNRANRAQKLSCDTNAALLPDGTLPLRWVDASFDGRYEQFRVNAAGHLECFTDRPTEGGGGMILGLSLVPLT